MPAAEDSTTDGSAFPWILEHLLTYPGSYEIPLRTMYTNNVLAQSNRPNTPSLSSGSSPNSSPVQPESPHFTSPPNRRPSTNQAATEHFKSCLMEQISYLPSQPFSLPPSFITSFVRRCFTEDLCLVDFTQALTALDYLKDLENRRKRELSAALHRLGIDKETFGKDREKLNERYPGLTEWVLSMEEKEKRVEALYTQVYIGLRRWTLINEMRLEPFNKANCVAMLNTLYPPSTPCPPTQQLTSTILASQRSAFFRYIQAVEKNGKNVLTNLENQSRRAHDENGWSVVREIVDKYLRTANGVIEECFAVTVDIFKKEIAEVRKAERRADSGISFGTSRSSSDSLPKTSNKSLNKPLPSSPSPAIEPPLKKVGSTLERITRELRKMKSRSGESKEPDSKERESKQRDAKPESGERSLKKMKSTSALRRAGSSKSLSGRHSRGGSGDRAALFEIGEEQRERMIKEAKAKREREMQEDSRAPGPNGEGRKVVWGDVLRGPRSQTT